MLLEC